MLRICTWWPFWRRPGADLGATSPELLCLGETTDAAVVSLWTFVPSPPPHPVGAFSNADREKREVMLELLLLACLGWWRAGGWRSPCSVCGLRLADPVVLLDVVGRRCWTWRLKISLG